MRDTPRTDENLKCLHPGVQPSTWYVQADFARQLERELAVAQTELAALREGIAMQRKMQAKPDARVAEQIEKWALAAEGFSCSDEATKHGSREQAYNAEFARLARADAFETAAKEMEFYGHRFYAERIRAEAAKEAK